MSISLSWPCAESLYTRMSELWPCASHHLPEGGQGEKAANKQKTRLAVAFRCLSILLILKQLWVSSFYLYIFLSSISFFPQVQMETNVWWHIWGTLKRPGKKGRARDIKKKRGNKWVCMWLCLCVSICALLWISACVHDCFCAFPNTHHLRVVQLSMLWLVSHAG